MALTGLGAGADEPRRPRGRARAARRALAIDRPTTAAQSSMVATDAINLAAVLRRATRSPRRARARRARARHRRDGRPTTSEAVARDANNLGAILRELGDLAGARRCFERAIAIDERRGTPTTSRAASTTSPPCCARCATSRRPGELAERALAIGKETYGPEDPDVATFHSNLACVLHEIGLDASREDRRPRRARRAITSSGR